MRNFEGKTDLQKIMTKGAIAGCKYLCFNADPMLSSSSLVVDSVGPVLRWKGHGPRSIRRPRK
ncbi:hypothetical protein KY289_007211 [Solanum tuberosum]|nr:hypothetical protein KY289_007211 [Solanum tuberosum]